MKPVKAWWFSKGFELPHGDGRKIALGETHKIEGEIVPCVNGLHACRKIIDALYFAPGSIIWRVELKGKIIKRDDKLCASERKYLSGGIDASAVLRKFARLCALDVVHLWDCPEVVLEYLKTGDEKIQSAAGSAAQFAAWSAAQSAAWSAAWSAAESAAESAARSAAQFAARSAARSAAWSAAQSAARFAAESVAEFASKERQNRRLMTMINNFIEEKGRL